MHESIERGITHYSDPLRNTATARWSFCVSHVLK